VETWKYGGMGNMETVCNTEHMNEMGIWRSGDVKMWRCGDQEIWRYEEMQI